MKEFSLDTASSKTQNNIQPLPKAGSSKQLKDVKIYYIGLQNFVRLPETWRTQKICWRTFAHFARNLSHLE